jgi:hypothetical protein
MEPYVKKRSDSWKGWSQGKFLYFNGSTTVKNWSGKALTGSQLDGFKNPQWRRQVRSGTSATTPLEAWEKSLTTTHRGAACVRKTPASGSFINESYVQGNAGNIYHYSLPSDPSYLSYAEAESKAKARFLQKLIDTQRAMMGGVALGEAGRTLRLLMNPAKALRKGLDNYYGTVKKRTKKVKKVAKRNSIAAESWLEYQFGWNQLARDVEDASDGASRHLLRDNRVSLWAAETIDVLVDKSVVQGTLSSNTMLQCNSDRYTTSKVLVVFKGQVKQSGGDPNWGRKNWGLATQDFLPTVWELIPYSFVIDYFINIGKIIDGVSYRGIRTTWSQRTIVKETRRVVTDRAWVVQAGSAGNYRLTDQILGSSVGYYRRVERSPYTGGWAPSLEFKLPGSNMRWLNLAALANLRRLR